MRSSIAPTPPVAPDTESEDIRENHLRGCREGEEDDGTTTTTAYSLAWKDGDITSTQIYDVDQLRSYLRQPKLNRRHLLVLHGLSVEYGVAIREEVGIDDSYIGAHSGRRSYNVKRAKPGGFGVYYDYPEFIHQTLVPFSGREGAALSTNISTAAAAAAAIKKQDLLGDAPSYAISTTGDGVTLCRASLWLSGHAHTLCLDRVVWEGPNGRVSRGRYTSYTAEAMPDENGIAIVRTQTDLDGKVTVLGEEIQDFETMLCNDLRDGHCSDDEDDILRFLEDLAIKKWDDFLDILELDWSSFGASGSIAALLWRATACLERNLVTSRQWRKVRAESYINSKPEFSTEWEALLSRLDRRVRFLSCLMPIVTTPAATTTTTTTTTTAIQKPGESTTCNNNNNNNTNSNITRYDETKSQNYQRNRKNNNNNNRCSVTRQNPPYSTSTAQDENQRSLNRVTYLGGVLLPFSVVSGILAIDTSFGPGEAKFWVFWAVSAPLALVTLAVIYADSIRKAEVWVEVAANKMSDSDSDSDSDLRLDLDSIDNDASDRISGGGGGGGGEGLGDPDVEQGIPIPVSRLPPRPAFSAFPPGSTTRRFTVPTDTPFVNEALGPGDDVPLGEDNGNTNENDIEDEDEDEDEGDEPDMMVEKLWENRMAANTDSNVNDDVAGKGRRRRGRGRGTRRWRKEELGWMGAFATLAQLYKLKKGAPPAHLRHG